MDSISVRRYEKVLKVEVGAPGEIGKTTLRTRFLLPRDLQISLCRNGVGLICRREREDDIFVLGHDWKGQIFDIEWDESRRTRLARPMYSEPLLSHYESIMADVELMKKYVFGVDGIMACATSIGSHVLATCYHCIKHRISISPDLDEVACHRKAEIGLTHVLTGQKITAKIMSYSFESDIVLLRTGEDVKLFEEGEFLFDDAHLGQPYCIMGTPNLGDGNQLQVINGRIFRKPHRTLFTKIHTMHGHGSARPEASGGPVFARLLTNGKPNLLGIVASGQTIDQDTKLGTFESSNCVKILSILTLAEIYRQKTFKF